MAADYYLKIPGITGEVQLNGENLKESMQIDSWSWAEHNTASTTTGTGLSGGKVSFSPFQFSIRQGQASAQILKACATGKHFDKAVLTCRKSTGDETPMPFLEIEFNDLCIESYNISGSGGPDIYDSATFSFTKITYTYLVQKQDGTVARTNAVTHDVKMTSTTGA